MFKEILINNYQQLRTLQQAASASPSRLIDIGVHDCHGNISDCKSIMGLLALDYSKPVKIVVDDEFDSVLNRLLNTKLEEESELERIFLEKNPSLSKT